MISASSLKSVWNFRGFILGSVKREYQLRYRGTMLGIAWTVLQPLAMIFVYTVIFSQVMRAKLPGVEGSFSYSIYLCAGIITWGLFTEIIQRSQSVFLDNANLIKKLSFPRLTLPIIVVAIILQVTGIWNDFIFGLVFAGRENFPMTVQLNNVVNSTQGEREYNVDMAATILTALVPLAVYFISGRWFVRGIAAGAVKG